MAVDLTLTTGTAKQVVLNQIESSLRSISRTTSFFLHLEPPDSVGSEPPPVGVLCRFSSSRMSKEQDEVESKGGNGRKSRQGTERGEERRNGR